MTLILKHLVPRPLRRLVREAWLRFGRRIYHRPQPLQGSLVGMRFCIGAPEHQQFVFSRAGYEPAVCEAISRLVKPSMVCVDVGANLGYLTLVMARASAPGGRIIAFEAHPGNAELLRQNLALNGFAASACVEQACVSDATREDCLLYEGDSTLEFSLEPRRGHTRTLQVRCVALDDYFSAKRPPDFVKIDVEGAEYAVVRGMLGILRSRHPACLIELHGEASQPVLDLLLSTGYELQALDGAPFPAALPYSSPRHVLATSPRGPCT